MATTYKRLASYFLQRDLTSTVPGFGSGYYYGGEGSASETTVLDDFNSNFNSIKTEVGFDPETNNIVRTIVLQPDGKILISGDFTTAGGAARNRIARFNSDGTLDTGFDPDINNNAESIVLQPDGKILIGGYFSTVGGVTRTFFARLNSDGSLDTSFTNLTFNARVDAIALQPDGKILVGGNFKFIDGVLRDSIARLNSDGTLDTGFDPDANNDVFSIVLQPDGKILIGGVFTNIGGVTRNRIARLNSDGSLDTSFNPNANAVVGQIVLQPDDKILICGGFTTIGGVSCSKIARLNSDGSLDTSFINDIADWSHVYSIALQPDGKILAGANDFVVGGVVRNYLARLNNDGTLDTNFDPDADNLVFSIVLQPDGKILIGGYFETVGGAARNRIARLKEVVNNAPYLLAYTVPENTQVVLKDIFVTNHNDFPVFHDIAILPEADGQEGVSEKHYYVWDNIIDKNDYDKIESSVTLSAGDEIYVYSSTDEDISFNIFGVEIS